MERIAGEPQEEKPDRNLRGFIDCGNRSVAWPYGCYPQQTSFRADRSAGHRSNGLSQQSSLMDSATPKRALRFKQAFPLYICPPTANHFLRAKLCENIQTGRQMNPKRRCQFWRCNTRAMSFALGMVWFIHSIESSLCAAAARVPWT